MVNQNLIHHQIFTVIFSTLLASLVAAPCVAQEEEQYIKTTQMIPVRDGIRLYTEIYSPREQSEPLPIIFLRTPYRVANDNGGFTRPGWYVTMALIDPHPALRAASPQASPSDYFIGDDFFHFGAFRLSPSAELPYLFDFDPKENSRFPFDQVDTYEFFLDMGPLSNMNARYLHGVSPTWDNFMAHSTYDGFWETGSTLPHLSGVAVPTLNVVGWWDAASPQTFTPQHLELIQTGWLN